MKDSHETLDSTDEKGIATGDKATGNIFCRYITDNGATEEWRLIKFDLVTQYDARNRVWSSNGKAYSNKNVYMMQLTYDVSKRVLTITLQGYVFTVSNSVATATNYNDRSTLNIVFLKDAEGYKATNDHYTIKGNARLNISL